MKKTLRALVCQMCGNFSRTKSEIMKHYQKDHVIFFIPNCRSWNFKTLLEKAEPILVDVGSQPFQCQEEGPAAESSSKLKLRLHALLFISSIFEILSCAFMWDMDIVLLLEL